MRKVLLAAAGFLAASVVALAAAVKPVVVNMNDGSGTNVGTVTFTQHGKTVDVQVVLMAMPAGEHALHVHAGGTCTPPDFTSAAGHLNPDSKHHGFLNPDGHHAGDFPMSVKVKEDGKGSAQLHSADISLDASAATSIYGKTVVIHELVDDQKTDPAGASGKRIACGVIPSM